MYRRNRYADAIIKLVQTLTTACAKVPDMPPYAVSYVQLVSSVWTCTIVTDTPILRYYQECLDIE